MSSILKALRKLEEEKAARPGGSFDIARDILRSPSRRRSGPQRLLPAGIFFGVLLVGGVAYLLSSHFAEKSVGERVAALAAVSPPAAEARAASPETPAEPCTPGPQTIPPAEEAIIVEEAMPGDIPAFPEKLRKPFASAPKDSGKAVEQPIEQTQILLPAPRPATEAKPPDPPESAVHVEAPSLPLVVSGIAFQDDPEARLAIINDLPVMVGTAIEGAIVEEILADRVRFSAEGRTFEVWLQP